MKLKIIKNYLYNLSYQLLSMIIPLITVPFILSKLTQTQIGINSYVCTNATYFTIVGMLGMKTYGTREIARVKHNPLEVTQKFWSCYSIQLTSHIISILVYTAVFSFLFPGYKDVYYLYLLLLLSSTIDISWFYQGLEDFKGLTRRNFIIKIISLILMFVLIKGPDDFNTYILILYIPEVLVNIFIWVYAWKKIKDGKPKFNIRKAFLRGTLAIFLTQFLSSIYSILDKSMVGFFANMEDLALYDNAQKLVRMIISIISSLSAVMMPRISMLISENRINEMKHNMKNSSYIMWTISIGMVFGIIGTMNNFSTWFFGEQYSNITHLLLLLSFVLLPVTGANLVAVQYLIPTGNEKPYTLSLLVAAVLDIVMNFILIPKFSAIGAAYSLLAAETIAFLIQILFFRKEMSLQLIFSEIYKPIIAGGAMYGVLILLSSMLSKTILSTVVLVITGIIIYFSIILLLNYGNFRGLFKRIRNAK